MRIILLDDITLNYSSVPEDQYDGSVTPDGLWDSGTTYSDTAIVYTNTETPNKVYQSLVSSNLNNDPMTDYGTNWGDLGATDRWRMFDEYVNTVTTDSSQLTVEIDTSRKSVVGIFNITGESVELTSVVETNIIDLLSPSFGIGWSNDAGNTEYDCSGTQTTTTKLAFNTFTYNSFYYEFTFTVQNRTAGSIAPYIGGVVGDYISTNGVYTVYVQSDGSSEIGFIADSDFIGSIDHSISIKLCSKKETVSLVSSVSTGWYSYFMSENNYHTKLLWDFPKYQDSTLKISILNSSGNSSCGVLAVGTPYDLGYTDYGCSFGISDFSYKSTNETTGDTTLIQGNYADEGSFDLWLTYTQIEYVKQILTSARGVASIYDFNNEGDSKEYLFFYGFYEDFNVTIPAFDLARCALDIQGLI